MCGTPNARHRPKNLRYSGRLRIASVLSKNGLSPEQDSRSQYAYESALVVSGLDNLTIVSLDS